MPKHPSRDDLGLDEQGRIIARGETARARQDAIVSDPRATPILVVAELDGEVGVRTFGPPSVKTADLLDQIATQYRNAVALALFRPTEGE